MTGHTEDVSTQRATFPPPSAEPSDLLPRLIGLAAFVLAAIFSAQIIFGIPVPARLGVLALGMLLLLTWLLLRAGKGRAASLIFPSLGWILVNATVFASGLTEPMLLAGSNAVVTLIAAALLGPSGVLPLAALTVLLGMTLALLNISGLLGPEALPPIHPALWSVGGGVYLLISWFGYYALRQQHSTARQAHTRARQLETLSSAAAAVTASLERDETIRRILRQLEKVVPYDSASVLVLREGYLEIVGGRGWDELDAVVGIQFPVPDDNPNSIVIETQRPYILEDAPSAHPTFRQPPHDHIRSWLGIPVVLGDRLIGMLSVDSSQYGHFDEQHARLASAFADHVAIALENARLFEAEQRRRRRRLTAVQQDITQVTNSSLDLDFVLQRVSRLTAAASQADRCLVFLRDPQSRQFRLGSGQTQDSAMPPEELARVRERDLLPPIDKEQQVPYYALTILNPSSEQGDVPEQWHRVLGAHCMLIAPLVTHQRLLGAMVLIHQQPDTTFDQDQIDLVQTVAASVSASIENARLYAQMERMAVTDPLTDLYNRRGLEQMARREIEWVLRYERPLSLMMLDLDEFKQLNDTHGHTIGDAVLVGVADLLGRELRSVDVVSRYGGEEFVILLPESGLAAAGAAAERLRARVESHAFNTEAGEMCIRVSIGIASTEVSPVKLDTLIDHADKAMYAAKQAGRNQVWSWHQQGPAPSGPD